MKLLTNTPKVLTRVTKRGEHQVYQPGFNPGNSCWLIGGWITVPPGEWSTVRLKHEALYADLFQQMKTQHHRNAPTPQEHMSEAQRQAWETFSGTSYLYVKYPDGETSIVDVALQGDHVRTEDLHWLREQRFRVIKTIKTPNGQVIDQADVYSIPEDLIASGDEREDTPCSEPANPWADIVEQNRQAQEDQALFAVDFARTQPDPEFMLQVAMETVFMIEKELDLEIENFKSTGSWGGFFDPQRQYDRVTRFLEQLRAKMGEKTFDRIYSERRKQKATSTPSIYDMLTTVKNLISP